MSDTTPRVLITQSPVGTPDRAPLDLFDKEGVDYTLNPLSRILNEEEMLEIAPAFDIIFSGTSPLSRRVIEACPNLKFISRAGIGLDSVDLLAARERNIPVSYTPDGPTPAVAEFTLGLMLSLTRSITAADRGIRDGAWLRRSGRRLENCVVGLLGMGRTSKRLIKLLAPFGPRILACDLAPDRAFAKENNVEIVDFSSLVSASDILSLHIPRTHRTKGLISAEVLGKMPQGAYLINTARGGIVDEAALHDALSSGHLAGAAMDVFDKEPYTGPLAALDNVILTCHMAASSPDCSRSMELGAAAEICRFIAGEDLQGLVPDDEYEARRAAAANDGRVD